MKILEKIEMKKFELAVVLMMALSSYWATAQDGKETVDLSLEQAVQYAVDHNRTLANASLDIKKAEAAKWQTIAAILPQVKGTVDYSTTFGYVMDLGEFKIAMPASAVFGVQTAIGFSGASIVSMQIAEISKKMADINLKKTEKDIKNNVKGLYYSALVVKQSLDLLEKNLEQMERLYEITKSSVRVGVAEQTDADQIAVQLATVESSVNSTQRNLELAYNSLRLALCLNDNVEIILTQDLEDLVNIEQIERVLTEQFVLDRNYDYQLLEKSTELARKQVSLVGWSNGPSLSVYHQYSKKEYLGDGVVMNMTPPNMLGATLTIPIFTFGKATAARKEAIYAYQEQLNTMADTELQLKLQYRQYMFNLTSSLEKLENQIRSVDVAQRVFDNISKKFEQGMASSLEVTNSGTNLITSQTNYVQAVLEVVNAKINLDNLLNI